MSYFIESRCHVTVLIYVYIMASNVSMSPVSDLEETEPVVLLLALFLLKSKDQLLDLISPGLCDQRLRLPDFCQQLIRICSAWWENAIFFSYTFSNLRSLDGENSSC